MCRLPTAGCRILSVVKSPSKDSLLVQTPESLKARFNLDVRINTEVIRIDRAARRIRVRELETGREYEEAYDALILSTGASPLKPPIPGIERPNHFVVRNIPDVEQIMAWSKDCQRCRAVVVGGGYIGLEMAEQLRHRGFGVTVVEALPQVMAPLRSRNGGLAARGIARQWRGPASERSRGLVRTALSAGTCPCFHRGAEKRSSDCPPTRSCLGWV